MKNVDKKCTIFLSTIGLQAYKLLSSLVALESPSEKAYTDFVKTMTDHHSLPSSSSKKFHKFKSKFQKFKVTTCILVSEDD